MITASETSDPPSTLEQVFRDAYKLAFDVFTDAAAETVMLLLAGALIVAASPGRPRRARPPPRASCGCCTMPALVMFLRSGHRVGYVAAASIASSDSVRLTGGPSALARVPRQAPQMARDGVCARESGAFASWNALDHFKRFQRDEEVDAYDDALAALPHKALRGVNVVTADVVDRGCAAPTPSCTSARTTRSRRAALCIYCAGYPHSPFASRTGARFRRAARAKASAWSPDRSTCRRGLRPYFQYVLERGHGSSPPPSAYHPVYRDALWEVWKHAERSGQAVVAPPAELENFIDVGIDDDLLGNEVRVDREVRLRVRRTRASPRGKAGSPSSPCSGTVRRRWPRRRA